MKTFLALTVETEDGKPEHVKRLVEEALDWIQYTGNYREISDFTEFEVTKVAVIEPTSVIGVAMNYL